MFPSRSSFFSTTKCPSKASCSLINCFFNHKNKRSYSETSPTTQSIAAKKLKPNSASLFDRAVSAVLNINGSNRLGASSDDLPHGSPKPLPGMGAPAKHRDRMRYIMKLANAFAQNGCPTPNKMAVEGEFKVATSSTKNTYTHNAQKYLKSIRNNKQPYDSRNLESALEKMTDREKFNAVSKLVHSKAKLATNDYVVEIPSDQNDDSSVFDKKTCNRCRAEFHISSISEKTKCTYHERKKRKEKSGVYWECCSRLVGDSQGCKTGEHHVFKATSPAEMHSLIPFIKTPHPKILSMLTSKNRIVGLDCEMGYTSKGLELIRLTVVDFFSGETIFDEIVKPSGKVLDLNTQWSGVSEIPADALTLSQLYELILYTILDSDTIIIGHGLENDLNAMRLVHHNVVDTAILFPKGAYQKFSLKDLSFEMLDRKIQIGEHSSEEDSLAAIDIIKAHIIKQSK